MLYKQKETNYKIEEDSLSTSSTLSTVWNRLSHLFQHNESRRVSTSSTSSTSSSSSGESRSLCSSNRIRRLKHQGNSNLSVIPTDMSIPPFSPTYSRPNEFPYSNFYVKLPNGRWMVRYRSGNRDILGTDEFEGYLI